MLGGARRSIYSVDLNQVFLVAAGLTIAALTGMLIPFLGLRYSLVLLALFGGSFAIFAPSYLLLYALVGFTLFVLGPLQYFGGVRGFWIPFVLGVLMYLKALADRSASRYVTYARFQADRSQGLPGFVWVWLLFLLTAAFALAIEPPSAYIAAVSFRGYVMLWGVMLAAGMMASGERTFVVIGLMLLVCAVVQSPFSIYQHFVVAVGRADQYKWDSVVGTFLGSDEGGGDSGGMAIFVVCIAGLVLHLRHRGILSLGSAVLWLGGMAPPLLMAEVKVAAALLPTMLASVYWKEVSRSPVRAMGVLLLSAVLAVGLIATYFKVNQSLGYSSHQSETLSGTVESVFRFSLATDVYRYGGEMGRATAIRFWWDKHRDSDLFDILVGHGPGASITSGFYEIGAMGQKYAPYHFDNSSVAALLWDTGLMGTFAFLSIIVLGAIRAGRLARQRSIPTVHLAGLAASATTLVLLLVTTPYTKAAVGGSPQVTLLLVLTLGYVWYWHRKIRFLDPNGQQTGKDAAVVRLPVVGGRTAPPDAE